jgi:GNAT superfamily N-acetyltransferase
MTLHWHPDRPARWDADKARIIGDAEPGIFDARFNRLKSGDPLPGEWWRVADDGDTVGYGWLDIVWGDAEIVLATAPDARHKGVGTFTLDHLEHEARERGLNYLYNTVRPSHPRRKEVSAWLEARGFNPSEDGSLLRAVANRG